MSEQPSGPLPYLIRRLTLLIQQATGALEQDPAQVAAWQQELSRQLARYHTAAFMAGAGVDTLSAAATAAIAKDVAVQLRFLGQFALSIQSGKRWENGWNARAASYANSIKVPYWRGKVKMLPLPAMPAQGTQCFGNCGCAWEVQTVDEDKGDYDAWWRRSKDDSCQTCIQRERDWSPVHIREGVLQL
jgi:hypothetical protein